MTGTSHAAPYSFQSPLVLVPLAFKEHILRFFSLKTHKLLKHGHMNVVLCILKWLQNRHLQTINM